MCALFLLTACGDTRVERAGSGAVIGGVTGLAVGIICCGDPFDGAQIGGLIGAAGGAALGALTPRPLFFNHEGEYWPYESTAENPPPTTPPPSQGIRTTQRTSRNASTLSPPRYVNTLSAYPSAQAPTYAPAPAQNLRSTLAPPPGRDYR